MARPREFDIDQALHRAMRVFWAKGYDSTSLADLLAAMGIARGSLYKAFKDKHSIYLAALDRYDRTVVDGTVAVLRDPAGGDGLVRVRRLLEAARDGAEHGRDRWGCFMCNAAIDRAPDDPAVRAKVLAMMKRLERGFAIALAQSGPMREWPRARREESARLLTGAYLGLQVLVRAGYQPAELDAVIAANLRPLRSEPSSPPDG